MEKLKIRGARRLIGEVRVSGAKKCGTADSRSVTSYGG